MVRLGLCCTFLDEPIKFRTTTARYVLSRPPVERERMLDELALHNARALRDAIAGCAAHDIGAFRVTSGILPMYTHPVVGWRLADRDAGAEIATALRAARELRREARVRVSFHPDQFVVPGSANPAVVAASLLELEYQAEVAELIGAEQLTIRGGGARGGKQASLERLVTNLAHLSRRARERVVFENDDRVFTVEDLLPICDRLGAPLVYDVHHHRCNSDRLDVAQATERAAATWQAASRGCIYRARRAAGTATIRDRTQTTSARATCRRAGLGRSLTIDVEAKAKERAVLRLRRWFDRAERRRPHARARA